MNEETYETQRNGSILDSNFSAITNFVINNDRTFEKRLINYYLTGAAGMTVCCLGIVCNILSFVVLTRKTMKTSTYTYLSGLAICDLLVLFTTMLLILKDTKYPEKEEIYWTDSYYAEMFPIIHPIAVTFQVTSIWLTLAFTVDRYIMICHPFKAERMCDIPRARRVVVALYLGGLTFNIPRFFEYRALEIDFPDNVTRTMYMFTEFGNNHYFREIVHSWLYLIFVCMIPFFTMAVLNAFLIHAVHLSRRRGKAINAKEKRRNDTTIMLIGVIIVFFICQTPALISRMIWAFNPKLSTNWHYHLLNETGNFLVTLNSATNIIPYYFFGKRFRNEFWRSFCFCFMGKENVRRLARSMSLSFDRRFSNVSTAVRGIELNGISTNEMPRNIQDGGATTPRDGGANGTALVLEQDKTRTVLLSTYNNTDTNLWTSLKQKLIPTNRHQQATDMGMIGGGDGGSNDGSNSGGGSRRNSSRHHHYHHHQCHKSTYNFKNKSLASLCLNYQKTDDNNF